MKEKALGIEPNRPKARELEGEAPYSLSKRALVRLVLYWNQKTRVDDIYRKNRFDTCSEEEKKESFCWAIPANWPDFAPRHSTPPTSIIKRMRLATLGESEAEWGVMRLS